MTDLALKALEVNQAFQALGNERFEADGATFIRNRDFRAFQAIRDANHVTHVTAATSSEIEALLARVEREFAGFPHRRFDLDFTTPPAFEARLALDGYQRNEELVMLLEGELAGQAKSVDIRPIRDEAGWEQYEALHEIGWREYREGADMPNDEEVGRVMARAMRLRVPPARYWLAYVDGEARAHCSSWEGPAGMGQVEDLFTHPDFRHQGLATTLVHHCVSDCRKRQAGPVILLAAAADTPKQMYARVGFRPIATKREYWKEVKP